MDVTPGEASQAVVKEKKRHSFLVDVFIRLVKEKPLATVGGAIVLALLVVGIFAPLIAPYGYNEFIMADRLASPSAAHWFGCDNLGRDLLSRIIYGARISMYVGIFGTLLAQVLSISLGIISGYVGGKFDILFQRFVDAWQSLPQIFIALTLIAILGPGLWQVITVLGCRTGIGQSRVIRSAVIGIKENVYLAASRAIGVPTGRILVRHVFPNITAVQIILFTITLGHMILAEASLSFLGFGIPPPTPSWGGMLSGEGRRYMILAPWMCLWPGLALALVIWGINMLGDGLRDLLDPRLRGGLGRYGGISQEKLRKMVEAKKS